MYEYVKGLVTEIAPTYVVIETGGVGYIINISLQTYSNIGNLKELRLWVHHVIREDSELMFGFFEKEEREIFRLLTGIPGIGPNTARMILSSLSSSELRTAIMQNDILRLQNIKGIGSKTAQRLVVELKDKIIKISGTPDISGAGIKTSVHEEALSALLMLGFAKAPAEKVIINLLRENNQYLLEDLIKAALKQL